MGAGTRFTWCYAATDTDAANLSDGRHVPDNHSLRDAHAHFDAHPDFDEYAVPTTTTFHQRILQHPRPCHQLSIRRRAVGTSRRSCMVRTPRALAPMN